MVHHHAEKGRPGGAAAPAPISVALNRHQFGLLAAYARTVGMDPDAAAAFLVLRGLDDWRRLEASVVERVRVAPKNDGRSTGEAATAAPPRGGDVQAGAVGKSDGPGRARVAGPRPRRGGDDEHRDAGGAVTVAIQKPRYGVGRARPGRGDEVRAVLLARIRAAIDRFVAENGARRFEPGTVDGLIQSAFRDAGKTAVKRPRLGTKAAVWEVDGKTMIEAEARAEADRLRGRRGLEPIGETRP